MNSEWIERLLRAAAAFGLLKRHRSRTSPRVSTPASGKSADVESASTASTTKGSGQRQSAVARDLFYLNAASAVLCSDAPPGGMRHFVKLLEDNAAALSHLTEVYTAIQ